MIDIPNPDISDLRKFALTMAAMITGLFGLLLPWLFGLQLPYWPWGLGLGLVVWGLCAPASIKPLYKIWMYFGLYMNRITTPIILGSLFFLILTPTGWLMRTFKSNSMTLKLVKSKSSYRVNSVDRTKEDMEKPF